MAPGPLATRWAKDVSADKALPEYPRPQMVRKDWMNLNGLWDYAIVGKDDPAPKAYQGKILVPFCVESALSGVMKKLDEKSRLWYRRSFEVPKDWSGKRVLLHFGAVDRQAAVYVNGKEIGTHNGGYDAFSFDVTDALKSPGPQELVISAWDPTDNYQAHGKQTRNPGGIMYTACSGIWQTVWMEPVGEASVENLLIVPDVDAGVLRLTANVRGSVEGLVVEAAASAGGKDVARAGGKPGEAISIPIKDARLWSPDTPFLYDLKVTLKKGGAVADALDSYFGMRKIAVAKDDKGIPRLMLNGTFVFQVGPLDQGFWPDGIYTAPTDEALKFDIEITRKLGMNMARKHVKIEPDRWYYWCDKLGLLVWQDMPSGNEAATPKPRPRRPSSGPATAEAPKPEPESKVLWRQESGKQFEKELKALIDGRRNHPSIIMWIVFNEAWGQYDTERLTQWVKQYDPSRLASCASGWTDFPVGDVIDVHSYPGPASPKPTETRAAVLGEFGGLKLTVDGHTWSQKTWGYKETDSPQALTQAYVNLLRKVHTLKESPGLNAAVYTQTTDVETECNGLVTYDRAVVKVDANEVVAANRGRFPPPPETKTIVPTAQNEPVAWRYTIEKPADDWLKGDFDASAWKEGPAGFGTKGTPGSAVRTEWKTADIWIRREFTLPEGRLNDPQVLIHHDEDAEVYLNGVPAVKVSGFTSDYEPFAIGEKAKAALKPGRNVLAVHCHQTSGGQYIDVGIVDVRPASSPSAKPAEGPSGK
jgi:hypothetical protein